MAWSSHQCQLRSVNLTPAPKGDRAGGAHRSGDHGGGREERLPWTEPTPPHTLHRGRLTQHDGIHSSPRTELDHDLQRTQQGQGEQGGQGAQLTRRGGPSPRLSSSCPGTVHLYHPHPHPKPSHPEELRGTSFIRKRKARLPCAPQVPPSPHPPFALQPVGLALPASQLPHFLCVTAGYQRTPPAHRQAVHVPLGPQHLSLGLFISQSRAPAASGLEGQLGEKPRPRTGMC